MKTNTEIKFDKIVKEGFHEILKPLGFKKKANNFYLQIDRIGQIINIQKSQWGSKDNISFTINVGIFVPEYWLAYYNSLKKPLPIYPTEPECLIRKRIGDLKNQHDQWYELENATDEHALITEMRTNFTEYVLPFFESYNTIDKVLNNLENENLLLVPMGKLITFGEFNMLEKAKAEYTKLSKNKINPYFIETLKEYAIRYNLDKE